MTDAEIIKALECCTTQSSCIGCPYDDTDETCYKDMRLLKDVLDLINRQKAESERLRKELNIVSTLYQDEQERYKELLDIKCDRCIARDKAEAIKEFAERLKTELSFGKYIQADQIDNLVKEMEGE